MMRKQSRLIELFLISNFCVACTSDQENSIIEQNKELVLTMNLEVWNKGNLSAIDELFSAKFVQHLLPDSSELKGIEALLDAVREHREAFPDWTER